MLTYIRRGMNRPPRFALTVWSSNRSSLKTASEILDSICCSFVMEPSARQPKRDAGVSHIPQNLPRSAGLFGGRNPTTIKRENGPFPTVLCGHTPEERWHRRLKRTGTTGWTITSCRSSRTFLRCKSSRLLWANGAAIEDGWRPTIPHTIHAVARKPSIH